MLLESWRTFYAACYAPGGTGHAGICTPYAGFFPGPRSSPLFCSSRAAHNALRGYVLLAIFGLAIVIHGLHREFGGLEILVVYAVAVWVTLAGRNDARTIPAEK